MKGFMRIKIPQQFIYEFAERILREAGTDTATIENDLESFVYESGERNWEEYEDDYGNDYFIIDYDEFD
jgi:hypothetical protein